jgi:GntR family histidine utilization transcriptional repressor
VVAGTQSRPGTLYDKVKQHVVSMITSGRWVPNSRLPSEQELMDEFSVSRMTVHRALRELTEYGMLVRIPGVGTFVSDRTPKSVSLELRDIAAEIQARGSRHGADVVTLQGTEAHGEIARELEVRDGSLVFHSIIIHRENEIPVQLEERHVIPRYAPSYLDQDFRSATTFSYLYSCSQPTQLEHYIYGVLPTKRICQLLEVAQTEPCILLQRRTWVGKSVATFSRFYYPGSRYRLRDVHKVV